MKMFKKFLLAAAVAVVSLSSASMAVYADEVVLGDVTADGAVTLDDAQKVLKISLGIESLGDLLAVADVDGSGVVDLTDAQKVLKLALGITEDSDSGNSGSDTGEQREYQYVDEENKLAYNIYETYECVVCEIKNNNSTVIELEGVVEFYNGETLVGSDDDFNYCFEPGSVTVLTFMAPFDDDYNKLAYDTYTYTFVFEEGSSNLIYGADKITYTVTSKEEDYMKVDFKNTSNKNFSSVKVAVIYYDKDKNVIYVDTTYADCGTSGSTSEVTFYYPYDENYEVIVPDSYEIFVNNAYAYNWEELN